jgi:hypothetical protein
MKFSKVFFFLGIIILVSLACGVGDDLATPLAPTSSSVTSTAVPSVIPRLPRTPTSTRVWLIPTSKPAPTVPAWVTDFSDPILAALDGKKPDIQDEFVNFDQGWFYFVPGSQKGPYYAHIQNETLLLQLPAENEKRDYWVYNPKMLRGNFVLRFEFQFLESQPEDTVRFQFDQTSEQGVAFDVSKNLNWTLHWGSLANWQSHTGGYSSFPPEPIIVLVMAKDKECAVYLNDVPLAYLTDCRSEPVVRSSPWAMTFHMLAEPGHVASATIDNLKFWDLDKVINTIR